MSDQDSSVKSPAPNKRRMAWVGYLVLGLVAIGATIAAVYLYSQLQQTQTEMANPGNEENADVLSDQEIKSLVQEVKKIVILPSDELPQVVTVTDKESITENKEFFEPAQNGDKVLLYNSAGRAFLYRPETKQIVNLAPINPPDGGDVLPVPTVAGSVDESDDSKEDTVDTSLTVELRNGTEKTGLTFDVEQTVIDAGENIEVVDKNSAGSTDYSESVLVVVDLTVEDSAVALATKLGIEVGSLPDGEAAPTTDVVIILGADQL